MSAGVTPPFRGVPPQSSMRWAPAWRACIAEEGVKQAISKEGMTIEIPRGGGGGRRAEWLDLILKRSDRAAD